MKILAIETSCDETGIAVLDVSVAKKAAAVPRFTVIQNFVASQIPIHRPFGGVVPSLAKREHLINLPLILAKTEAQNPKLKSQIDFITVTVGPGLEPALWTGIEFAKQLAKAWKKPLVGANHLEGHLYSFLLPELAKREKATGLKAFKNIFPSVALIVSGGHTILLKVDSLTKWKRLGETRDDAVGEAFDKVARLLELPYPGGPEIEKLARTGDPKAIVFPRPMIHDKNYDFSFSGLKTSVLYYLKNLKPDAITPELKQDVAASFQQAAIDVLTAKTLRAVEACDANSIILCGGVAANKALRKRMASEAKKAGIPFFVPEFTYNLDNAAMIGAAGYMAYARKKKYPLRANGNLEI